MAIVDPVDAVAAWLRAQSAVVPALMTSERVYAHELPDGSVTYMPRVAVVISGSGGPGDSTVMNLGRQRIDVRVYGKRISHARATYGVIHQALKHMVRKVTGGALLHSADLEGGPVETREPDTGWPLVFASYQLLYAEHTV